MSYLTFTKEELKWLTEHLKATTEQYQEPEICYQVLEKCHNMLSQHLRYEFSVNWFNKLVDDIEKTCVKGKLCNHAKIHTGAYPRSNPPKKCDICEAMYYE